MSLNSGFSWLPLKTLIGLNFFSLTLNNKLGASQDEPGKSWKNLTISAGKIKATVCGLFPSALSHYDTVILRSQLFYFYVRAAQEDKLVKHRDGKSFS